MQLAEAMEYYRRKEIPENVDYCNGGGILDVDFYRLSTQYRDEMISICGYVIITKELCREMAKFIGNRKVLELMCGLGALTKGLRDTGVDVIVTDNYTYSQYTPGGACNQEKALWVDDVERIDAVEAVKKYGKECDVILLSWSPYCDPVDCSILEAMREVNKNAILICITEGFGGCCNSDAFFEMAEDIDDDAIIEMDSVFRRHTGLHDHIMLFK